MRSVRIKSTYIEYLLNNKRAIFKFEIKQLIIIINNVLNKFRQLIHLPYISILVAETTIKRPLESKPMYCGFDAVTKPVLKRVPFW
jgi:hypothetical protein